MLDGYDAMRLLYRDDVYTDRTVSLQELARCKQEMIRQLSVHFQILLKKVYNVPNKFRAGLELL